MVVGRGTCEVGHLQLEALVATIVLKSQKRQSNLKLLCMVLPWLKTSTYPN